MLHSKLTRMEAAVGLAVVAIWAMIVAFEQITTFPWNQGDYYVRASQIVNLTLPAVFAVVGFLWLLGRSRMARRI